MKRVGPLGVDVDAEGDVVVDGIGTGCSIGHNKGCAGCVAVSGEFDGVIAVWHRVEVDVGYGVDVVKGYGVVDVVSVMVRQCQIVTGYGHLKGDVLCLKIVI